MHFNTLRSTSIIFPEKGSVLTDEIFGKSRVFVICDTHTKKHCIPAFKTMFPDLNFISYCIPEGEGSKSLRESDKLIKFYIEQNINRNDIIAALGGGVVCDITGFTASLYKRGIRCALFPTTLLGMVDAAIGGKNGIDYKGIKNLLGNFYDPEKVVIYPGFLKTLDPRHMNSGKAEVLKAILLGDRIKWESIKKTGKITVTEKLIEDCIRIKSDYVSKDYYDKSIRHTLNFGHTIGHAIEAYSMFKHPNPLIHGEAVAAGMLCEIFLSHKAAGLKKDEMEDIVNFIVKNFKPVQQDCMRYENLVQFMMHDKKNESLQTPLFTLLEAPGTPMINKKCNTQLIIESLKYYLSAYKNKNGV